MNTGVVVATGTINGTYEGFLYLAYLLPSIQGVLSLLSRLDLHFLYLGKLTYYEKTNLSLSFTNLRLFK